MIDKNEDEYAYITDNLYIVEGKRICYKCNKETKVIALDFVFETIIKIDKTKSYKTNAFRMISLPDDMPQKLKKYLAEKYNIGYRKSGVTNKIYLANCCEHCNSLQGNFYLFRETDGPFFIINNEEINNLNFKKNRV